MILILTFIFFIFGLIIGSFLNVVIFRFNTRKSFFGAFGGRSGCMVCQNKLSWYELIPVLSFLGLLGRCRKCKTKISIQYPIVELVTGIIFTLLFLKFQDLLYLSVSTFSFTFGYFAIMFSLLIVIAVYDLKHKIIPDMFSVILGILAFMGIFFFNVYENTFFSWHIPSFLEFLSGPILALPFYLFWLLSSGRWMGLGDAKLVIGLGWLFGFVYGFSGIVFAFWIGAIVGLALIVTSSKYGMKSEIPFAPYLVLGTFLAFFLNYVFLIQ